MNAHARIIGLYGVAATGKTTLCQHLFPLIPISEAISTDSLLALRRAQEPDLALARYTSYLAWQSIGARTDGNVIEGFLRYRSLVQPMLETLYRRASTEHFTLIVDGIHFSPSVEAWHPPMRFVPVLLTLADPARHRRRIHEKCAGRTALEERLLGNIETIRTIQEHLITEARAAKALIIDTGLESPSQSLRTLRAHIDDQ